MVWCQWNFWDSLQLREGFSAECYEHVYAAVKLYALLWLIGNSFFISLKHSYLRATTFTSNIIPLLSCQLLRAIISNDTLKKLSDCANCSSVGGVRLRGVCFSGWHETLLHYLRASVQATFGKHRNGTTRLNMNEEFKTTNTAVSETNLLEDKFPLHIHIKSHANCRRGVRFIYVLAICEGQ